MDFPKNTWVLVPKEDLDRLLGHFRTGPFVSTPVAASSDRLTLCAHSVPLGSSLGAVDSVVRSLPLCEMIHITQHLPVNPAQTTEVSGFITRRFQHTVPPTSGEGSEVDQRTIEQTFQRLESLVSETSDRLDLLRELVRPTR